MGLLDFFIKKKPEVKEEKKMEVKEEKSYKDYLEGDFEEFAKKLMDSRGDDFLGLAAMEQDKARAAMKEKEYNKAWQCFDQQRMFFLKHAEKFKWNVHDSIRLSGSVHENFANIFRLENKHPDALVNFIYSLSTDGSMTPNKEKKMIAYFNRLKLKNTASQEVSTYVQSLNYRIPMSEIKNQVKKWVEKG
jgi:hypothetical protein